MRKKLSAIFLISLIVLFSFNTSFSTVKVSADDECDKQCQLNNIRNTIAELEKEMEKAKADMATFMAKASEYALKADEIEAEINELKPKIEELARQIAELEASIAEKEALVEELNNRVLSRMESAQSSMHFSPMLDFLMGSNGFSDMVRRIYGIEAINAKEEKDRNELLETIRLLNIEKEELAAKKDELDIALVELEYKEKEVEKMRAYYYEAATNAEQQVNDYLNQIEEQQSLKSQIEFKLDDLYELDPLTGFSSPVPGSSISAGFPRYPQSFGGGVHLGVDYAARVGTTLYAPADGVIIVSDDNCPTYGYLGNSCGGAGGGVGYGGNQIYFLCSVNGKVYALTFSHLYSGSLAGLGVVLQGTPIAKVGSSGNSSGPHCHIEMYYLGKGNNEDLQSYINAINNGRYSKSFNCGWGSAALPNNCDNKGSAPCRLNGANYLPG